MRRRLLPYGCGSSTIALEASKKSQLGINIDDLKSADGEIALVGTYDLSKLTGAEAMISNASTVTYTLSLQRRGKDGYAPVGDISKYITVFGSDKLGAGSLSGSSYVLPTPRLATRLPRVTVTALPLSMPSALR